MDATNVNAAMNLMSKQAVANALALGVVKARTQLLHRVVNILRAYRTMVGNANTYDYGTLGPLSVMLLGMLKSDAFRQVRLSLYLS